MLVDVVEIEVSGGRGGDGIVSWRREKYVPRGGPDGGDGGRGGQVTMLSTDNLDTLRNFRFHQKFLAEDGHPGGPKKKTGRSGDDLELLVPTGTIVTDLSNGEIIADFKSPNIRKTIVLGGHGGKGNSHFATSVNQKPEKITLGQPGQHKKLQLELRYVADVALVGLPNAGKSSLINALTNAGSKVGAYAFSTTHPVLGVLHYQGLKFTLIDLPGLIEGAYRGRGLGHDFLRHAKRVRAVIFVVEATSTDIGASRQEIEKELGAYDSSLLTLPSGFVLTKSDLLNDDERATLKKQYKKSLLVSSFTRDGIGDVGHLIYQLVVDRRS